MKSLPLDHTIPVFSFYFVYCAAVYFILFFSGGLRLHFSVLTKLVIHHIHYTVVFPLILLASIYLHQLSTETSTRTPIWASFAINSLRTIMLFQ